MKTSIKSCSSYTPRNWSDFIINSLAYCGVDFIQSLSELVCLNFCDCHILVSAICEHWKQLTTCGWVEVVMVFDGWNPLLCLVLWGQPCIEYCCCGFHIEKFERRNCCSFMYAIRVICKHEIASNPHDWYWVKWVKLMWLHLNSHTFLHLTDISGNFTVVLLECFLQ